MNPFPVTASTLCANELGHFISDTYFDEPYRCSLFRTGINHTYFLKTGSSTYVLRVYSHNWRTKEEIEAEIELLIHLRAKGMPVSYPIQDKNNGYIQELNAPEGLRYAVVFSYAPGEKVRFMDPENCFKVGVLMAQMHQYSQQLPLERTLYNKNTLIVQPYDRLKAYFSETLPEMALLQKIGASFQASEFETGPYGMVHLDIWYDNMAITNSRDITLFDFDFCGNGPQMLDLGYFCKQLFHIEADKKQYELKKDRFLQGYQSIVPLDQEALDSLPKSGLAVFMFYLGVQAQRFDWSNVFLSENYLKMFVGLLQTWMEYHGIEMD